ncbi:MAG: methylmalonyl Co-A mutase-associated GTPase MeaB [Candidatus Aminicenantes bacterium]|nr:methylmalonyl Co-A mutase-associated GTPase MeaB [Candidatus Aminicenantes bacterium]
MRELAKAIERGDQRAVAQGISIVENDMDRAQRLIKELFANSNEAVVIGVTGVPGSGKSTLVDQMIDWFRKKNIKLGVVAVDPSSPFTGGAVLGDRLRMMRHSTDPGVFIRSMATRGYLGGLAKSTGDAVAILEASGKEIILVETVGVGQDEVEVVSLADVILVVLVPEAGDDIQIFKAGLMEIADIFVLNKSDSPDSEKTEARLKALLELDPNKRTAPPVFKTIATTGEGIDALMRDLVEHYSAERPDSYVLRRKRMIAKMLKEIINVKVQKNIFTYLDDSEYNEFVDKVYQKELDPYTAADMILKKGMEEKDDKGD